MQIMSWTYFWSGSNGLVGWWAVSNTMSMFGKFAGLDVQIGANWNFNKKSLSYVCSFPSSSAKIKNNSSSCSTF